MSKEQPSFVGGVDLKNLGNPVQEFLRESNEIEGEYTETAFQDAFAAWVFATTRLGLTLELVVEIHEILMKRLNPRIAGRFRKVGVSVGGRVCPNPDEVYGLMLRWVQTHKNFQDYTEEEIMKAHIGYEWIHAFEDSNGRSGRIILNWMRLRAGLPILVIKNSEKQEYYKLFE